VADRRTRPCSRASRRADPGRGTPGRLPTKARGRLWAGQPDAMLLGSSAGVPTRSHR
jgi:hypothetical protein